RLQIADLGLVALLVVREDGDVQLRAVEQRDEAGDLVDAARRCEAPAAVEPFLTTSLQLLGRPSQVEDVAPALHKKDVLPDDQRLGDVVSQRGLKGKDRVGVGAEDLIANLRAQDIVMVAPASLEPTGC